MKEAKDIMRSAIAVGLLLCALSACDDGAERDLTGNNSENALDAAANQLEADADNMVRSAREASDAQAGAVANEVADAVNQTAGKDK